MNVEIKTTKSNKEKGGQSGSKKYGMIPRTRALRIGEVYFPTKTMISLADYERIRRILDRSKYTRVFQESNKELLKIIKDLNPHLSMKELELKLFKYEEFEQPKEMAIALEEEVENINKIIQTKNREIEDINKQTDKRIDEINTDINKTKKEAQRKIKDIKKDLYELKAEVKKLKTRAEKYKKIKYDRK